MPDHWLLSPIQLSAQPARATLGFHASFVKAMMPSQMIDPMPVKTVSAAHAGSPFAFWLMRIAAMVQSTRPAARPRLPIQMNVRSAPATTKIR